MAVNLERELDDLYGADLDEFTERRNALAKLLRDEGEREEAERVKKLRKPVLAAWAVNQLAREARGEVDRLLDAGHRVREAQKAALETGDAEALERTRQAQTSAVTALVKRAREILSERRGSVSDSVLDRVATTLRAASVADDGRELLARGRLDEEVEPAGFEAVASMADVRAAPARARETKTARERKERVKALREDLRTARDRESELRAKAREARRAADKARKEAERLRDAADRAEERADEARRAVEEVQAALDALAS